MLQILPITLAQVRAGNTCLSLLNEIRKIIHSLYQEKEITKKVYNNIMNSIKLLQKYGYSTTSNLVTLLLKLTDRKKLEKK